MTTDAWTLYADLRDRFISLLRELDDTVIGAPVPLTPAWSTADVVAHVCGLNADVIGGAREGLGTDEATEAQVQQRRGSTVEDICREWLDLEPEMRRIVGAEPLLGRRLAADLLIHFHDVSHAVGRVIERDDEATRSAAEVYASRIVDRWATATGMSIRIELTDGTVAGPDASAAETILRATPFDFLRSVSGRRSRRQVAALDWSGDPSAVLDHFSPYAPLGDDDAPI